MSPVDGRVARAVDELVHLRRLVAHGVEDGIVAVIAPVEEVFGVIEPAREHVGVERHFLLVQFGAPVGAGHLVDGGVDADLAEAFLHQDAERLVDAGEIEIERNRGLEAVGEAGLGQQRLGLRDVGIILGRLRPCDVGGLAGRRAEHRIGETEQHHIHDLLIGDRVGDGLAHLRIVERRLGHVHADILDAVGERQRHDVELAGGLHLLEILERQFIGDVGIAALEQRAAVAGLRHHAPDHALDLRHGAADPLVVALHDDFGAGGPLRHLVGAGARGLLLGIFETPGILLGRALLHQFGIDDAGHDHGEIGNRQPVLLGKVDAHGVVVDDDELLGLRQRTRAHLEGRETADADRAIERPFDVLGRHRRAVVEFGVLLQLEGHRHVADLHVLGEFGLELVAVVIGHAAGAAFHLVADQPVVAIPRHFIAGHVGADAVDVEIVGAAFGDDQQRFGAGIGLGGGPDRRRRHHGAGGDAGGGFQKIATLHVMLQRPRETALERTSQGSCQKVNGRLNLALMHMIYR